MQEKKRKALNGASVLLGVTGSVAAYKAADLIRRLKDEGALVSVVMTDASCRFITPLSLELAAGSRPLVGMFDDPLAHIELARKASLMVVAPATANTIAKFALGLADDLLSACHLAYRGPFVIAPAMNWRMYENPAFRRNMDALKALGAVEVEPEEGALACGEQGKGRMAPVERIVEAASDALTPKDLSGMRVVVTAGPTREFMDPVRFLSNRSSGKMGYAIARAARARGADVVLVSGPSALAEPSGVRVIRVTAAKEMREAVLAGCAEADVLVMAAAVADFAPASVSGKKLPKSEIKGIELEKTPDILAEASRLERRPLIIGFAAETGEDTSRAERKLREKGADFIVFNNVSAEDAGFETDTNRITIISASGSETCPLMSKDDAADAILDRATARNPRNKA